jgi:hypothetical protein
VRIEGSERSGGGGDARLGQAAEKPVDEAGLEVAEDVPDELREPELDRGDEVAQEPDRVLEHELDRVLALLEDRHQLGLELGQELDHLADGFRQSGQVALVLVLDLLGLFVRLFSRLLVFLGQLLGEVVLLLVDALAQLVELRRHLLLGGLADGLEVLGQAGDVVLILAWPFATSLLASFSRLCTKAATRSATASIAFVKFARCRSVMSLISFGTGRKRSATQRTLPAASRVAVVLELLDLGARARLHVLERRVHAAVEPRHGLGLERGELGVDRLLRLVEDLLDVVGDFLAPVLVLLLGRELAGLHLAGGLRAHGPELVEADLRVARGLGHALGQRLLLLPAVLLGAGVRVLVDRAFVGDDLAEARVVRLLELRGVEVGFLEALVGGFLARLQRDLFGGLGRGHGAAGIDRGRRRPRARRAVAWTGLPGTAPVFGGASEAAFMPADAWSDCSFALPETAPLSCSFSPPSMNLSASSRVFGMTFSISARSTARKLSGSGLPASADFMSSTLLACAPASFSLGGPWAAACASAAFFDGGGCCLTLAALVPTWDLSRWKRGSLAASRRAGFG